MEVKWDATTREYCHVLQFSMGWQMPPFVLLDSGKEYPIPKFSLYDDYEFRVPGVLGTRFFARGVDKQVKKSYTINIYEADLSDPQPASEDAWNSATPLSLVRRWDGITRPSRNPKYVEFSGLRFTSSGDHWDGSLISPDRAILLSESWSGTLGPGGVSDVPGDFSISLKFGNAHGNLFFDVFSTDTGKKLIALRAHFASILPEEVFGKTGWVTERYFIVPLDERREHCLICDFGKR